MAPSKTLQHQDLIAATASVGVTITVRDVDELLLDGVDRFLHRRQIDLSAKYLDRIYIILFELKHANE